MARAVPEFLPIRGNGLARSGGLLLFVVLLGAGTAFAVGDRGADGDFERRDSFHFTLYQDVDIDESAGLYGSRRFEQEILRELEAAFDRLDDLLALRPEGKLVVYVWDPRLFDEKYAGLFRFPAAGFYAGAIHIRGATRLTPGLVRVLHHELVHAAFDAEAPRLTLPAWMNEGIAEWFEARAAGKRAITARERGALAGAADRGELFSLADLSVPALGGFQPVAAALAYLESYAFIDFLVQAHGERGLVRFWSAVVRSRSLERGARRAYRKDLEQLEADFFRSLRTG
ncbi:MAG: hypothetical protein GY910_16495 [bacterium]|nr:hypothetical protein [bacterium]